MKIKIDLSIVILLFVGLYGGFLKELGIFSLIIILHELAHIIVARFFNIKCTQIYLTIIGGLIELNDYQNKKFLTKLLINSAGVLMNFLLIVIYNCINHWNDWNNTFIGYNYLMIVINLLPITPLDGYKISHDLLNLIFDEEYTIDCLYYLSLIIISILGIILFILKLYGYYLILFFLLFKTVKHKNNNYHKLKQYNFLSRI